jgi:hypothetical protein
MKALSSSPSTKKTKKNKTKKPKWPDVAVHICNSSIQEAEAETSQVQPELHWMTLSHTHIFLSPTISV